MIIENRDYYILAALTDVSIFIIWQKSLVKVNESFYPHADNDG